MGGRRGAPSSRRHGKFDDLPRVVPAAPNKADQPREHDRETFQRVNEIAGTEPVRRELSGLAVRKHALRLDAGQHDLRIRWQPSLDYRCRKIETDLVNHHLREGSSAERFVPPILFYVEENDLSGTRLQPLPRFALRRGLPLDLGAAPLPAPALQAAAPAGPDSSPPHHPFPLRRFLGLIAAVVMVMMVLAGVWFVHRQAAHASPSSRPPSVAHHVARRLAQPGAHWTWQGPFAYAALVETKMGAAVGYAAASSS